MCSVTMNSRSTWHDLCNIACNLDELCYDYIAMKTAKKKLAKHTASSRFIRKSASSGRFLKKSDTKGSARSVAASNLSAAQPEAADVRRLSRAYNLSTEVVSRVTGASPRTVAYWNSGTPPQRSSLQRIKEVTRLFDALADIIKGSVIGEWLQRPNRRFDGSTPLQVIERGETDRLWRMIWQLREGNSG
jgi:DNA-binding transcriptional regulator YiaG